jgi:hypothetical protein
MCVPLIITCFTGLLLFLRLLRIERGISWKDAIVRVFNTIIPTSCTIFIRLFYTALISSSLNPFVCVVSNEEEDGTLTYLMRSNPIDKCFGSKWYKNLGAAIFFFALYGVMIPFYVAVVFHRNRKKLEDEEMYIYFPLTAPYKRSYFYWEIVQAFKRLCVTSIIVFQTTFSFPFFLMGMILVIIIAFFSGLEIMFMPYLNKNTNLKNSA